MNAELTDGVRYPKIYGFTTPTYANREWKGQREGQGLIKVGYTDQDVNVRIKEILNPTKLPEPAAYDILLTASAIKPDGSPFLDHPVHAALERAGVHRVNGEWFECTIEEAQAAIDAVKADVALENLTPRVSFAMRPEQQQAVTETATYLRNRKDTDPPGQYLWNAKMRFGKTFTTYQLARELDWTRILVLTYKPAVETAWRTDLETHTDFTEWRFKGKNDNVPDPDDEAPLVWFASFQDVLGTDENGQPKTRNENLYLIDWDAVVIDEYHFGAWRDAARDLYLTDKETGTTGDATEKRALETGDLNETFRENLQTGLDLTVNNYLYLSGTPFRALTQGEFLEDQVFNWTYSNEQEAKTTWTPEETNPYASLPRMNLLVYEMPEKLREVAINNNSEFSLTEFFRTENQEGVDVFTHKQEIQKWLDLLRGQDITGLWANVANNQRPPLPFEDTNLLRALQHTVWYLPSVGACKAMRDLLAEQQNVFYRDYTVNVAAGPGAGIGEAAKPPVDNSIGNIPQDTKTITLTCGKLMTGVTVPAWTGIFMLRELKSPESYFQAAFRVQSPWAATIPDAVEGGSKQVIFKHECYVLDFAPNRALSQIVDYATRLSTDVASQTDKEQTVDEFMEFLPVLSFDGYAMKRLSASDVIDYLTSGVSASMLARRWNSPELITLNLAAMEKLLENQELIDALEEIEMFRNISNDLTAMINSTKEVGKKKVQKKDLTPEEKDRDKSAKKVRDDLKKRLQRFITRIPAFMYLTDDREKTIKDIITQLESDLFEEVTSLSLKDFQQLVDAGVFNDDKMNDAVWKFRTFEEPSLHYGDATEPAGTVGGWNMRRDERLAELIDRGLLTPGDSLTLSVPPGTTATISEDYGIVIDGIRHESPDAAANGATDGAVSDGWAVWTVEFGGEMVDIAKLRMQNPK